MKPLGDVATVPLFDRLTDSERWMPREAKPLRTLDWSTLRASVAAEIERILSTRSSLTIAEAARIDPAQRTVLDYGVPDFAQLDPNGGDDAKVISDVIRNALVAYEPRLIDPRVRVVRSLQRERHVIVEIAGMLGSTVMQEPFSFAVSVSKTGAEAMGTSDAA